MDTIEQLQDRVAHSGCEVNALRVKLRDALARRAREEAARGVYRCLACKENFVDPSAGEDTCGECLRHV